MSEKKPAASSIVRTGGMVAVGVMASSNPVGASLVGAAIEPAALVAGHWQEWISARFGRRVSETTGNLLERAEAEGIESDPEKLAELLESGLPFVGRASVEEKRRLMEEILMNGIRSLGEEGKKAEAIEALNLIEELPLGAVLIFSAFLNKLRNEKIQYVITHSFEYEKYLPNCGMNKTIINRCLNLIFRRYDHVDSPISSGFLMDRGEKYGKFHFPTIYLTDSGEWLAEWITNNPAPRPEAEEAPPTE
jgi:hypothetical protein